VKRFLLASLTFLLLAAGLQAAPSIPLQSGTPVSFSLAANSLTTSYFINAASSDRFLRINLDSSTAGVNIGMYLRHGTPFPDSLSGGRPISLSYIEELSHYRSIGPDNAEWLQIGRTGAEPLRAGPWYLLIVNLNLAQGTSIPASIALTATLSQSEPAAASFAVNFNAVGNAQQPCSTSEWFDNTPATPSAGNTGTTLGAQRRNAMLRAAELLAQELQSPVPINIDACWDNLGTGNSVTLAQAGPRTLVTDLPSMPRKYTWYADGPTARLSGTAFCKALDDDCSRAQIRATFNNQVDTASALGAVGFHYGFQASTTSSPDFITVALHEITHGLGFISLVEIDPDSGSDAGTKFLGTDDIFSAQLSWLQAGQLRPFNQLSDAERMQAAAAGSGLKWIDASATNSISNPRRALPAPDNYVQLYAPNPISAGSSVSHIDQDGFSGELMRPFIVGAPRTLSLARPMLDAVGWSNAETSAGIDPVPFGGFFYDPRHSGHGIEFSPVTAGGDVYVLIFYTYDAAGNPEWFLTSGRFLDGRFLPEPDVNGNSLQRFTYDPTRPSGQRQQVDASVRGRLRLDFVQAANAPTCVAAAAFSGYLAVMTFTIGDDSEQTWCMQELIPAGLRPSVDMTGTWYAGPQDSGWGLSLGSLPNAGSGGLFSILYYYDGQGKPRWALATVDALSAGSTVDLLSRNGYCRTCALPAGFPAGRDSDVGSISFSLQPAGSAGSQVSYSASWPGIEAGTFARTASPLTILSIPAADQQPQ